MNLQVLRLGRPLTSLLGGLATFAATLVGVGFGFIQYSTSVLLAVAAVFIFAMASSALNDFFDHDIDKINHPERPLPSGKVTPTQAVIFSIIMFTISTSVAFFLGTLSGFQTTMVFLVALVLQIAYEGKLKKMKAFGNFVIGLQAALAFIFGGSVVKNVSSVSVLSTAAFLSIVGREIVKDIEDVKGDVDKMSLPKIVGTKNAGIIASLFVATAMLVGVISFYPLSVFGVYYFMVVLVANLLFMYSISLIFKNPFRARRTLKFAMLIATTAFIVGGISAGP